MSNVNTLNSIVNLRFAALGSVRSIVEGALGSTVTHVDATPALNSTIYTYRTAEGSAVVVEIAEERREFLVKRVQLLA